MGRRNWGWAVLLVILASAASDDSDETSSATAKAIQLSKYYDDLTSVEDKKRNPENINSIAVHRWLGKNQSTVEHYRIIRDTLNKLGLGKGSSTLHETAAAQAAARPKVFDAGCGLGSAMMWLEEKEPSWDLLGHTISQEQLTYIDDRLPAHKFKAKLASYDDIGEGEVYDAIFSIEALVHSPNLLATLQGFADHMEVGGQFVVIDDFLTSARFEHGAVTEFYRNYWLGVSVQTRSRFIELAEAVGFGLVAERDIGKEYDVVRRNYLNKAPPLPPIPSADDDRHYGFAGGTARRILTVQGKMNYLMLAFRKEDRHADTGMKQCAPVPVLALGEKPPVRKAIQRHLMTGEREKNSKEGGTRQKCLSGWYCCGAGVPWFDNVKANRTHTHKYLTMQREWFGEYLEVFAKHLTSFYATLPGTATGKFIDIGATGNTGSGMKQVVSKFAHMAGPLEYWQLDIDEEARGLDKTIVCDVDDCPGIADCEFDVTFSHTVLEHAAEPWKTFDTIARITKKGGLSLHLVPWSYQWHSTPADYYRFSHQALTNLFETRGFEVLEVGYDLCNMREPFRSKAVDEHFDFIWLTYVVARKL